MVDKHHALAREEILEALSAYTGVTTADGATPGNNTLIDSNLIGKNDFISNKTILLQSGNSIYEDGGAIAFNPLTGQITVSPAFSSQVLAGTGFYILNAVSASIVAAVLAAAMADLAMARRPLIDLHEGWQDEAGIDAAVWTVTNPATGAAWARGAIGENLMAYSSPNLGENARLRSNQRWVIAPTLYGTNKILRRFVLEFEMHIVGLANLDNANFFLGLTPAVGDTRVTPNIIGFALVGALNALQTLTNAGGAETLTTGFGENLLLTNKFRIEISFNSVVFSLNEVVIATHIVNLPSNAPLYLNFYAPTGGVGAATIRLGIIRAWTEDI